MRRPHCHDALIVARPARWSLPLEPEGPARPCDANVPLADPGQRALESDCLDCAGFPRDEGVGRRLCKASGCELEGPRETTGRGVLPGEARVYRMFACARDSREA